jgi:hypothetical protein
MYPPPHATWREENGDAMFPQARILFEREREREREREVY